MSLETRTLTRTPEVRATEKGRTIGGYAAVFNSTAEIGASFHEVIKPGAFRAAVSQDVRALIDHDSGRVIGRSTSGTLRLTEDDVGLAVEIDLPETQDGRDLATLIERGDVSGMSFGFVVTKQTWDDTTEPPSRTIEEVDLREVSVVAFPAYDDTSIALRSLNEVRSKRVVAEHNRQRAAARIAERRAAAEQKFRRIG